MRLIVLVTALWAAFSPTSSRAEPTNAVYDVLFKGIRVGILEISGQSSTSRYQAHGKFRTTGVIAALKSVRFDLRSRGRVIGNRLAPLHYAEDVETGRRSSSVVMTYKKGIPIQTGGSIGEERVTVPLDPARQADTVDPMTALFILLKDQPDLQFCDGTQPIFDGARRTRMRLKSAGANTCTGQFERLAGYTPKQLQDRPRVDFEIAYQDAGTVLQAREVVVRTKRGTVKIIRR